MNTAVWDMPTTPADSASQTSARRDLLLVCAGAALFWAASIGLELHERVVAWTRPWERYQLDELPGVLLFLSIALAWYSWRRVGEVRTQLAHRVAAEVRLAESLAENRRLSLSHVRLQEAERKELARELHDELGQHLNAIKLDAVQIRNATEGGSSEVHQAACSIVQATDHVQGVIRDRLQRLRPVGLDELGLSAALEHLLQHWRARHPATQAQLDIRTDIDQLGERANITLYRIVQEGLTNVVKHARAAHVRVTLERDDDAIALTIADDGAGAGAAAGAEAAFSGLGLVGMRERVQALGGSFEVLSPAGQGFCLRAALPLQEAAA